MSVAARTSATQPPPSRNQVLVRPRLRLVARLPCIMFLLFAAFWCITDLVSGLTIAMLPSVVVGALLIAKALLTKSKGRA